MEITKRHLIILMAFVFALLGGMDAARAADRTITLKFSGGGHVQYRIGSSGNYTDVTTSGTQITVADNKKLYIQAVANSGYVFTNWSGKVTSNINPYSFTVSSTTAGTYTANFKTCFGGTLSAGTYTITGGGATFTVTKEGTTVGTYNYINNLMVSGGTVTLEFNTTTGNVYFLGYIQVTDGELVLKKMNNSNYATLRRPEGNTTDYAPNSQIQVKGGKLTVRGYDTNNRFSFYGGCRGTDQSGFTIENADNFNFSAQIVGANADNNYGQQYKTTVPLFYVTSGTLDMKDAQVYHNWNDTGGGGGFSFSTGPYTALLDNVIIDKCYCKNDGAAMYIGALAASSIEMTNCEVYTCYSHGGEGTPSPSGGIFRTSSGGKCTLRMTDCNLHNNYNVSTGGAITWNACTIDALSLTRCNIHDNWSKTNAGGLYVASGLIMNSCTISNNHAKGDGGGIFYSSPAPPTSMSNFTPVDGTLVLDANTIISGNECTGNGGGIWVDIHNIAGTNVHDGNFTQNLTMNGATISGNKAKGHGGGVFMQRTTDRYATNINLNYGTISGNYANYNNGSDLTGFGGGIYAVSTVGGDDLIPVNIGSSSGTLEIKGNSAVNGGGIYSLKGDVEITGGSIGVSGSPNKSVGGAGGGIYVNQGKLTCSGGTISYNKAEKSGSNGGVAGGVYVTGATVDIQAGQGGTKATISNNEADDTGGGLSIANSGVVNFSDGDIIGNKAVNRGGGIYIGPQGTLNMSGAANVSTNYVTDASANGGGIYIGKETVSRTINRGVMTADGESLIVNNNTKGTAKAASKNNVYLPDGNTIKVLGDIDPTGVNLGIYTENEAVEGGDDIPVLTSDAADAGKLQEIYDALLDGSSQITDDREVHKAKYPGAALYTLYFTKIAYDFGVFTDDEPFQNPINSPLQLYKYMCWVNGLNGFTQKHAGAMGEVTANINMTGVSHWVPIGEKETSATDTDAFSGTFHGNGHVISNLQLTGVDDYTNYGLFGRITTDAEINDVFIEGFNFVKNEAGTLGTLVGLMQGGMVQNSIVSSTLTAAHANCITGGLVGQTTGGTVHSSAAMADMTGYQMGGLVGQMASGSNLYNSFANAKFHSSGSGYVGGLVGVNTGTVENCYAREQIDSSHGSSFGWLAGANQVTVSGTTTKGDLNYSYAPSTPYTVSDVVGNQTGVSTYGETHTPYLYKHYDNQVATASGNTYIPNAANKQLVATLNNWVNVHSGYSPWMRTCASPINADYPVFKYSDYTCVASTNNVVLEYTASFNTKFNDYVTANDNAGHGTIFLYDTPAPLAANSENNVNVSNNGRNTTLYIGEDVALKPASGTGAINATVGITLDNSAAANGAHPTQGGFDAMDWHMFSTSLQAAPLGINYDGNNEKYPFVWGGHPSNDHGAMPYWRFYPEGDASHGYFPSMEYSWAADNNFTYDATNTGAATNGNWYNDWDYYAYYEKEYHWINFKRNGNSHWHEDYPDVRINYKSNGTGADWTNETNLIKGRGYLVSTVEPTYLQCSGTLTTGDVPVNLTSSAWVRKGYNLLGNPYQSYLDFNAFADKTGIDSYYIIDEDAPIYGYAKYTKYASENEYIASSYIHPHQGFMVIVDADKTVTFTDAMRKTTVSGSFRGGERPAYPLVNLIATEENGTSDVCTVELGRPDEGGAPVMRNMRICKGLIYCRYDDEDWSIAFTRPGLSEAAIRFETTDDAMFTLTWDTENGDFGYLHLIDNMTGADIDCLQEREYKFTSRTSDYASRFRLVFGYTGIEETEDSEPVEGSASFAFQTGDGIVVNGEGTLQIIDMTGRIVKEERLRGSQSTVSVPQGAAGVYVLRLTGATGTRVQKIVVSL